MSEGQAPEHKDVLGKSMWTVLGFVGSYGLRFLLNVVLTRLLAPEMMGVLVIVNAVRLGMELLTDIGIEQNIIHHPDGVERHFRNVAWTMQVGRGALLSLIFAASTPFVANFYHLDPALLYVMALSPVIGGLHSTAIFVLVRKLEVPRRNLFELGSEVLGFLVTVSLVLIERSVWAWVIGAVLSVTIRSALSYLLPDARQSPVVDTAINRRIFHFGRWIALTSLLIYATSNVDRLFFGRIVPLSLVGVYGVARAIAEVPTVFARRLAYQILFPVMARWQQGHASQSLLTMRRGIVCLAGTGIGLCIMSADWVIRLIYDARYAGAGWILAMLLLGGLFAILANLNEALLLAAGRPSASSGASLVKLIAVAAMMPLGFALGGFACAVVTLILAEAMYYVTISRKVGALGPVVWRQDLGAVLCATGAAGLVGALRWALALGSPFAGLMAGL